MHIQHLHPAKSPGADGIPLKYLIMCSEILASILAKMYNNCIQSGTFPD